MPPDHDPEAECAARQAALGAAGRSGPRAIRRWAWLIALLIVLFVVGVWLVDQSSGSGALWVVPQRP